MISDKAREILLIVFFLGAILGLVFIFGSGLFFLAHFGWWVPVVILLAIVVCVFGFWTFKLSAF